MFQTFTKKNSISAKQLFCVPYENAPCKEDDCIKAFGKVIPDNSNIIYSSVDMTILGYYVLEEKSIAESKHFDSIVSATKAYYGEDINQHNLPKSCLCISEWVFDKSLQNTECLYRIMSDMILSISTNGTIYLWTDKDFNELLFYPINKDDILNYTLAARYFVYNLMNL